jgi:hypothetical protein
MADANFGDCLTTHPNRIKIIDQISKSMIAYRINLKTDNPLEYHQKFIAPHIGKNNAHFGKPRDKKIIDAMRNGTLKYVKIHGHGPTKGIKASDETRAKLSKFAKTRIGEKNSFYGKTHSKELIEHFKALNKGKKPSNMKPVIINQVEYESLAEASRQTGIKNTTILFRIRSKHWPTFLYKT